jgi:hypothetical protein
MRKVVGIVAVLVGIAGCSSSFEGLRADGGLEGTDGAVLPDTSPPFDGGTGDPRYCALAPRLPLDAVLPIDPSVATPEPEGSCFAVAIEDFAFDGDHRELSYTLEVPVGIGVEISISPVSEDSAQRPDLALVEGCAPLASEDRCVTYAASSLFPSEPGRFFYGNPTDRAQSLVLSLRWFGIPADPRPFTLTLRSFSLPARASCEAATPLAADVLLPASTERGGTYENWDCIRLPEAHFHTIKVPARHQTIPLEGSQVLRQRETCECVVGGFTNLLDNYDDVEREVVLERVPSEPLGVRFAPLPPNAACEWATRLDVAPSEAGRTPVTIVPYAQRSNGFRTDACSVTNEAVWYRVSVPPRRTVRVSGALFGSPYLQIAALNGACGEESECTLGTAGDSAVSIDLPNASDAAVERIVVVGYEGPDSGPLSGELAAYLLD